jgi:hypothetical protein
VHVSAVLVKLGAIVNKNVPDGLLKSPCFPKVVGYAFLLFSQNSKKL